MLCYFQVSKEGGVIHLALIKKTAKIMRACVSVSSRKFSILILSSDTGTLLLLHYKAIREKFLEVQEH